MKKLLFAALAMGLGASLYAQGTVTFANTSATLVTTNTVAFGGAAGPAKTLTSGGDVRVALYWGIVGATEAQLVQIGSTAGISPIAGRINSGIYSTGAATVPGTTATFQVRAWTGNYSTYEAAYAATGGNSAILLGASSIFTSSTGGGGSPPSVAISLAATMPAFSLTLVPEPSTYAILGVGMLGLLWKPIRRKVSK